MGWLIRFVERHEGPLVLRKLCSTLVVYFLQFSASWTRCVKHVIYCLCLGQVLPYGTLEESPETTLLIENITSEKATVVLWFASSLVEEVGKTDSSSMKQLSLIRTPISISQANLPTRHKFHLRVAPNAEDIVSLIEKYISNDSPKDDVKVRQEAMRCFQVRCLYIHFFLNSMYTNTLNTAPVGIIWC
jgi:hypothetical protein